MKGFTKLIRGPSFWADVTFSELLQLRQSKQSERRNDMDRMQINMPKRYEFTLKKSEELPLFC